MSPRSELVALLKERSVCFGEFTLQSGAKSDFYVDCRQTALHARGAVLIGEVLHPLLRAQEAELGVRLDGVGGLTLGADPIALAVAIRSSLAGDAHPVHAFTVRKEPKDHGRGRQIEGPFESGHAVAVVDDVITTGGSTLRAIDAVEREGGRVAFVLCLVNREEGGEEAIRARGIPVVSAFRKRDFVD